MEALDHGVVVGRAGRDAHVPNPLAARAAPKAPATYSGPLSLSTARTVTVAPVVADQALKEAHRVGPVRGAHHEPTKAQRVKTSMAVSWYTLPTPLSLPM